MIYIKNFFVYLLIEKKPMQTLFTESEIKKIIKILSQKIKAQKHDRPPVIICILNSAVFFFTDLVRELGAVEIDFVKVTYLHKKDESSYYFSKQLEIDIQDKDVYLVDDLINTGRTMNFALAELSKKNPKSLTPVALFAKYPHNFTELYLGQLIEHEIIMAGYGVDGRDGIGRNLRDIQGVHIEVD
jgi:hypoxanthine phosphoribosyltransferase